MNWEDLIINIIGNAINGLIVGIFTVIGVKLTIRNEKRKEEKQERKEKYNNKPELIVNKYETENEEDLDVKLLVAQFEVDKDVNFEYSDKYENKNEYIFRDFIFKNIGKTPIESLDIVSTYKKNVSIFNSKNAEIFMQSGLINYGYTWDKKIFPGQELKVRLYFHKDILIRSAISCAFIIQFNDSNGMYWEQPFFENDYKLYSPREISYKEYHEKGEAYLLVATSADEATTNAWIEEVKAAFPGMDVLASNLSLGICCHTGAGALGVGISCRPHR